MQTKGCHGFTLIELLVVVAIIVVLISVLMPSLSQARNSARTAACQSNLRQIALWGLVYVQEWNNVLPQNGVTNSGDHGYAGLSKDRWYSKYVTQIMNGRSRKSGSVLHCPQAAQALQPQDQSSSSVACNYGINKWLGGDESTGYFATVPIPKADLLSPMKFWFADARAAVSGGQWSFDSYLDMLTSSGNRRPWMWDYQQMGHPDNYANLIYGDAHAEKMTLGQRAAMTSNAWKTFSGSPN